MDRGRRNFFGILFGGAAAPVAAAAASTPKPAALLIANPICPNCCNCQEVPSRWKFETQEDWHRVMTTPTEIVCGNPDCRTRMTITFARST